MSDDRTYAAAGVSLATAEGIVERLRKAAESTGARGFGAFAGLHPLDERRLLAASTDSIGTKPIVARRRGALRACGADPLILLDYVAANHIDLEQVADLVEGAAEVCRAAGVALIGGETAELPGVYREDELDFAATCVGIVDRDRVIDGSAVEAGDYVIGLPSAGVHANGFTLVRSVLEVDVIGGDVVEQDQRVGAARDHVVDAVRGHVGAAGAQRPPPPGDDGLRPDRVGRGGEQAAVVQRVQTRERAEPAGARGLGRGAQPLHDSLRRRERDPGGGVRPVVAHGPSVRGAPAGGAPTTRVTRDCP